MILFRFANEALQWFLDRRVYLDTLETQLKGLLKATETSIAQRRALAEASSELSASLSNLSEVELAPSLTGPLASLSDLHSRIRDLYSRQAQQDVITLSTVIDEYIRLIGSIKKAFEQRQRSWQHWHNAESDLLKRRSALDKLHKQGRSQQDRMTQLHADVADAERRSHQARLTFEDLGKGMRAELERFEKEKVEDFRMGVETYLESSVEAQKEVCTISLSQFPPSSDLVTTLRAPKLVPCYLRNETDTVQLIEIWETYLMQLDADDEDPDPYADASTVPYHHSKTQTNPTSRSRVQAHPKHNENPSAEPSANNPSESTESQDAVTNAAENASPAALAEPEQRESPI